MIKVKYSVQFTCQNGKIKTSRVIGEENATEAQNSAIATIKLLLHKFVRSKLNESYNGVLDVRVVYVETVRGLQLTFKI